MNDLKWFRGFWQQNEQERSGCFGVRLFETLKD